MYSAYNLNKQGDNIQSWCTPFPILRQSSSNCCFLTCIQVSQEAGEVVWYCHLFKNFPQFVVIHTVKGFSMVSEAEIDFFWNSLTWGFLCMECIYPFGPYFSLSIPRSGFAGSYSSSILSFLRTFHTGLYSGCTNLHSHQPSAQLHSPGSHLREARCLPKVMW